MSLFAQLVGGPVERKLIDATALTWGALFGLPASKAGVAVNVNTALRVSAVLGCVRAVSEDIAQLPLKLMRERKSGVKEPARDHPLYRKLAEQPNDWQKSFEFREMLGYHAFLAHGGFAIAPRGDGGNGDVLELLPVLPNQVTPRQAADWTVTYEVQAAGQDGGQVRASFGPREMLVVKGPGWLSYQAMDLVQLARDVIGLSIAVEEAQSKLYANGVRPSGLISTDAELKKKAKDRLREGLLKLYGPQGPAALGLMVVDQGMKYQSIAMTGVDAQTLESRKYQVEEIARMFGLPPSRIGYTDKTATYASAEQFALHYVKHTIGPWLVRWEQGLSMALLTDREIRDGYFFHFVVDGLLRGDWAARSAYFKGALGTASSPGWMSPNDVRRREDLDPSDQPGADKIITVEELAGKKQEAAGGVAADDGASGAEVPPPDNVNARRNGAGRSTE